jgi:hypothetical protein
MHTLAPNFLWIDDVICPGQLFDGQTSIQINANLLISLVDQLTAIKGFLGLGVEEVQVVWFADLRKTILCNRRADVKFFIL